MEPVKEMDMTTIAKNRIRLIDEIFARATRCQVFSESNYFHGKECSKEWAKKELFQFSFAKLKEMGPGEYNVDVHANCWYELKSPVNLPALTA
jgi:hypothetical protein